MSDRVGCKRICALVAIPVAVIVLAFGVAVAQGSDGVVDVSATAPDVGDAAGGSPPAPGAEDASLLSSPTGAPTTTTTSASTTLVIETAPPTTGPARSQPAATVWTAPRAPTPTTAPARRPPPPVAPPSPPTTAPTPPAGPLHLELGKASWYDHIPGVCAHKTLPFGTVVAVTNTRNGRTTACTVGDRGPFIEGWIIDLNPREFFQLADLSAGVISVRIEW